ncbi:site-specific integrase [Eubacteriales bacterium OttesenSCG-928-N14]|nr:site-specific integrase [Eubacteriales bacterium OttesenSCG-928-N14]
MEIVVGWKPDGKKITKSKSGFKTKKEGYDYIPDLWKEYREEQEKGKISQNQIDSRKEELKELTFAELFDAFIQRHERRVSKSTIDCYKAAYKYYRDIHQIVFSALNTENFQLCVEDCPQGRRTKENMKALGTLLFKYAMELDITDKNFAQFIWLEQEGKESTLAFSAEQLERIFKAADSGIAYADYIVCLCYLGFRPTAFLQLKAEDYNAKERYLIGGIKTEAGIDRVVPISPKIQRFIDTRIAQGFDYIFPKSDGSLMSDEYFRENCFYPALAEIGIQPVPEIGERAKYSPRSCRNTFATLMKNVNGADKDKAALMGHTSYEMTLKYQREDLGSLKKIIDSI